MGTPHFGVVRRHDLACNASIPSCHWLCCCGVSAEGLRRQRRAVHWYKHFEHCATTSKRPANATTCSARLLLTQLDVVLSDVLTGGAVVLSDSPYPHVLATLLALAPHVRVAQTTRAPLEWAARRTAGHKRGALCRDDFEVSPFSWDACAERAVATSRTLPAAFVAPRAKVRADGGLANLAAAFATHQAAVVRRLAEGRPLMQACAWDDEDAASSEASSSEVLLAEAAAPETHSVKGLPPYDDSQYHHAASAQEQRLLRFMRPPPGRRRRRRHWGDHRSSPHATSSPSSTTTGPPLPMACFCLPRKIHAGCSVLPPDPWNPLEGAATGALW